MDYESEQAEVMGILQPYIGRMYPLFFDAVQLYNSEISARARAEHDTRAIASAVWCHAMAGFRREFIDEPGFHFLSLRGLELINVRDQLVMRVKKVDENGRHQNADTAQQRAFDEQDDLPELPPAALRLVMGYQPDKAFSIVERVTVRRPMGRWVAQVVELDLGSYTWTDITPRELSFGYRRKATG